MAISLITGIMGGGKSHQAIKYIVVPNYKKGRKILTNIKGLNEEELKKYCLKDKSVKEEDLGQIVIINDRDINDKNFYPFLTEEDNKEIINDQNSFVKSGDVVVIDEAAQFYAENLSKETLIFFTMHRHFTNDKGISCELCFLVQDHSLLNRKLVKLSKTIYICKKLDFLGFSKSYVLKIFDGGTVKPASMVNQKMEKYDKLIFPIYSSYAKGTGKEVNLDKRTNILNNWKFYAIIVLLLLMPFAAYKTYKILRHDNLKTKGSDVQIDKNGDKSITNTNQESSKTIDSNSSDFRITGIIDIGIKRLVMLEDQNHNLKLVQPQLCIGSGLLMTCNYENKTISYYNKYNTNLGPKQNENNKNNLSSNAINSIAN